MQRKTAAISCISIFLMLVMMGMPALAQEFFVVYPNLGSVRWYFNYPKEVDAGATFVVTATGEHVAGSPGNNPALRVNSEPTPIVVPVSTAPDCDPNLCVFGLMVQNDQRSMRMQFSVSSNAPPGQILVLKVDTRDMAGPATWQNVVDLQVTVKSIAPPPPPPPPPADFTITVQNPPPVTPGESTAATLTISVTNWKGDTIVLSPLATGVIANLNPSSLAGTGSSTLSIQVPEDADPGAYSIRVLASGAGLGKEATCQLIVKARPIQWWQDPLVIAAVLVVALVVVGIAVVFLLTRRKPSPPAAYKPYPMAPQPVALKPAAPQAIKPGAHLPRVVGRREEKK